MSTTHRSATPGAATATAWIAILEDTERRATWSGHWRAVSETGRRLAVLRTMPGGTMLAPCSVCLSGWDRESQYDLCGTCHGTGFEAAPAAGAYLSA